ncbi:MAG TPA: DUF1800 family protein [Ilumatobacteraceae bacterium]|nr:DUF1800 family protein [Ilumatobacteraceae bacterium]
MAATDDIVHLLRRTEYVARPERVAALSPGSYEAAVNDILNVPAGGVAIPAGLEYHDDDNNWNQYIQAVQWWFERMARTSPRPIQEKMAFFWHGHFCSEWGKVFDTGAMMQQNKLFRDGGLGNVRTLAQAMSIQPAMLLYLDNAQNRKNSPNQNFGRELLELFLLGVGNYAEADVEAATLAWTGHGVNWDTNQYVFTATQHDYNNKTFLGQTISDGPDVINVVLGSGVVTAGANQGQPSRVIAARFLSKKLWEAFAYQSPSADIVNALGDVLVANDFNITPWVKAMLMRPEFLSTTARQGLVKTPVEYITGLLYHSGYTASVAHPEWYAEDMGQAMFYPPNVSGWKVNGYWVNASSAAARASFASNLRWRLQSGRGSTPSVPLTLRAGTWAWSDLDAMSSAAFIDTLAAAFDLQLSAATRNALIAWSDSEKTTWGQRWSRSSNALLLMLIAPEMNVA